MNFLQVIAKSVGALKVDPEKVKHRLEIFRRDLPKAKITVTDGTVKAEVVRDEDGTVHCMTCGGPMVNRCNQYVKKGQWVQKKRNMSNWECPRCRPLCGGQPLATWYDDCYFPITEEVKAKAQQMPLNIGLVMMGGKK